MMSLILSTLCILKAETVYYCPSIPIFGKLIEETYGATGVFFWGPGTED